MKKIINNPENYIEEMLSGIYIAHHDSLRYLNNDKHCLVRKTMKNKVGIMTGGGSGHLPLFLGYVGDGLLDGCAVGDVFQSPSPDQILAITKEIDSGHGVLYIYGNYNGDIFNFDMAAEMAEFDDNIQIKTVLGADDVASAESLSEDGRPLRRGVAGIYYVYKCAGAAADLGLNLETVTEIAHQASDNVRTMGVSLTACTVPRIGKPSFEIADDEMEIGMGIHGEPGIKRTTMMTADEITQTLLDKILDDMPLVAGDNICVLVNGLGATPLDEQYIVVNEIDQYFKTRQINVYRYDVGEYATAIEMAGISISILKLNDTLTPFIDHPVNTPFIKQVSS